MTCKSTSSRNTTTSNNLNDRKVEQMDDSNSNKVQQQDQAQENHQQEQQHHQQQNQPHQRRSNHFVHEQQLLSLGIQSTNKLITTTTTKVMLQNPFLGSISYKNNNNSILSRAVVLCILLVVMFPMIVHASFTITIDEPGTPHCFSIRIPFDQDYDLSGNYDSWSEHEHMVGRGYIEKLKSNQDDNQLIEKKRLGNVWTSHNDLREDTFDIHIPKGSGGKYQLCFISEHDEKIKQKLIEQRQKEHRLLLEQQKVERQQRAEKLGIALPIIENEDMEHNELLLDYEIENDDEAFRTEPVTIGFNIHVDTTEIIHAILNDNVQGPEGQRALTLMTEIKSIEKSWSNLIDHFDFLRNRESYYFSLADSIHTRIIRWSIIEAFVVVSMSIGQVLYWRKFFEQRRYL